jgi:hypothetical protein
MDNEKKCPQGNCPYKPIVFDSVFEYFVDQDQKHTANKKDHKMKEEVFFLPDTLLGIFELFVLLKIYF